jgi:hypothetical protein
MYRIIHKFLVVSLISLAGMSVAWRGLAGEPAYKAINPIETSRQASMTEATGPHLQTDLINLAPGQNLQVEADNVHLILVGYTAVNGNDIGPDCEADLIAVQAIFRETFQGLWRNRLRIHRLYGDEFTAAKVRDELARLAFGPNDVVVFYHSGHGVILNANEPVETHFLMVGRGDRISRGEVLRLLAARPSRAVVVLTDCCSSLPQGEPSRSRGAAPVGPRPLNRETILNLFLRFRGFVDITAAEVGNTASNGNQLDNFGGARGAFTAAFLMAASQDRVFATWADFFGSLRDFTRTSSGGRHQAQAFALREGPALGPQVGPSPSSLTEIAPASLSHNR